MPTDNPQSPANCPPETITRYLDHRSLRWEVQTYNSPIAEVFGEIRAAPLVQFQARVTSRVRARQLKQVDFLEKLLYEGFTAFSTRIMDVKRVAEAVAASSSRTKRRRNPQETQKESID